MTCVTPKSNKFWELKTVKLMQFFENVLCFWPMHWHSADEHENYELYTKLIIWGALLVGYGQSALKEKILKFSIFCPVPYLNHLGDGILRFTDDAPLNLHLVKINLVVTKKMNTSINARWMTDPKQRLPEPPPTPTPHQIWGEGN